MKTTIAVLAFLACVHVVSSASDLVIERVVIKRHPIPAPYFASMTVKAGQVESSFHEAKKAYGFGGIDASEIEIRPHLVLKNVQLQTWATFTLQLDPNNATVTTPRALSKHTGRFQILPGSHDNLFIPSLHNVSFIYQVYWRVQ